MARRLRIEFPGAIYHLLSRGDRREAVFRDDQDCSRFIETLGEACEKTGWQVHAYVLMRNHFHLVAETPRANLAAGMKWLLGTYTKRFNRRHAEDGHLFSGRYKSLLVGGRGTYLRTVVDYVHLNPVRAGLVAAGDGVRHFRWSSVPLYLSAPGQRPAWLRVDRMFGECGIPQDSVAGRREFERRLEVRRAEELDREFESVRHGWCLGDEEFRRELLKQAGGKIGRHHYGPEVQESDENRALRLVQEEMAHVDWTEDELRARAKGDPEKLRIALRLRAETTMTLQWIAERLQMGTNGYLSHLLYWHKRGRKAPRATKPVSGRIRGRSMVTKTQPPEMGKRVLVQMESVLKPLTDPFEVMFDPSFD